MPKMLLSNAHYTNIAFSCTLILPCVAVFVFLLQFYAHAVKKRVNKLSPLSSTTMNRVPIVVCIIRTRFHQPYFLMPLLLYWVFVSSKTSRICSTSACDEESFQWHFCIVLTINTRTRTLRSSSLKNKLCIADVTYLLPLAGFMKLISMSMCKSLIFWLWFASCLQLWFSADSHCLQCAREICDFCFYVTA